MAMQAVPPATLHRLDTESYNRIVDSGVLEGQPVELIDGFLVEHMSPQSLEHAGLIARLTRHLASADGWLRVQLPLEVPPDSEPEPDLAVVEQEPSFKEHTRSARLVVEVSVSSHRLDRGAKARLYARAGVPTYWVVDVPARAVEVYTRPERERYLDREIYRPGACLPSPAPGVAELDVAALFAGIGD
jgi:Uma2 family endonuclease